MVYQPPAGARDLLPLDVAQKRWLEDRVQQVFHRWGYQRIITSTLERLDTLMAGGAVRPETVLQINVEDDALGLRPELTASIARTAVTRMAGAPLPQRLYYIANVFRRFTPNSANTRQELFQAGVELLGSGGLLADGEILLLLLDCLKALSLSRWHLILGEAELTRSLLSPFPDSLRDKVRRAIAHLDRISLETLPMSPELRQRALVLLDLRGRPADVIQKLASLDLDANQRAVLERLKSLVDLLQDSTGYFQDGGDAPSLILDLSLVQTFDYYTGIVFEVVSDSETGQRVLGQGGRYDQLLGLYHPQGDNCPGIGFCLNVEDLQQVLFKQNLLPQHTPSNDWLVVATTPQAQNAAFAHAQTLRDAPNLVRVEVYLADNTQPDAIRDYARQRRIGQIAWVGDRDQPIIEPIELANHS